MTIGSSVRVAKRLADQHTERACIAVVPIGRGHFMTSGMTPAHILVLAIDLTCAFQERFTSQSRRLLTQQEQLSDEAGQPTALARKTPVDPTDFVVLTIRIVVAALSATKFIAGQQHRYTLRQQQRCK